MTCNLFRRRCLRRGVGVMWVVLQAYKPTTCNLQPTSLGEVDGGRAVGGKSGGGRVE